MLRRFTRTFRRETKEAPSKSELDIPQQEATAPPLPDEGGIHDLPADLQETAFDFSTFKPSENLRKDQLSSYEDPSANEHTEKMHVRIECHLEVKVNKSLRWRDIRIIMHHFEEEFAGDRRYLDFVIMGVASAAIKLQNEEGHNLRACYERNITVYASRLFKLSIPPVYRMEQIFPVMYDDMKATIKMKFKFEKARLSGHWWHKEATVPIIELMRLMGTRIQLKGEERAPSFHYCEF